MWRKNNMPGFGSQYGQVKLDSINYRKKRINVSVQRLTKSLTPSV